MIAGAQFRQSLIGVMNVITVRIKTYELLIRGLSVDCLGRLPVSLLPAATA